MPEKIMNMEETRPARNALLKQIDQCIRKTGFNDNFIQAVVYHLKAIFPHMNEEIKSRQELCDWAMSKLFIDKLNTYPTKRFTCKVNENSDWPVPVLPSDVFSEAKLPNTYKIACFHKFLKVGDVLDCRIASILPSYFCLRVIHKYGTARILDDLNIVVRLPRNKSNIELLKEELLMCELIRVAVFKISKEKQEVIEVTVDEKSLECDIIAQNLGRINADDLPSYVLDPSHSEKYSSYSNYLNTMPQFRNPTRLNAIFDGLGIDPKGVYSFYPRCDRLTVSEENTGQAFLKKSTSNDAKKFIQSSISESKKNNISQAYNFIKMAINICPKGDALKSVLYQFRGDIYYKDATNSKNLKNAVFDWITAYYLDPSDGCPSKFLLSRVLSKIANGYYRKKHYKTAVSYAEVSLELNKKNHEAASLLDYLEVKHPESFSNYDEKSLDELHEQQKKLISKLQKFK